MDNKITAASLAEFSFFAGIPTELLESVAKNATLRTRPPRSFVYCAGDPADHVYLVTEGIVKLCTVSSRGRELLKTVARKGDIFGELALTSDEPRAEHAIAIRVPNTYISIRVADVKQLLANSPELTQRFTEHLGSKLRRVEKKVEDYVLYNSDARIVQLLIDMVTERGEKSEQGIMAFHFMTHQDMANITGASRQFVTSLLNLLRSKGIIEFDRSRVFVKDLEGLRNAI
jgi:CRP/FNR family cyclic AMP-dependent transcriptional regulator